jgi:hypothetical protein
MPRRSRIDLLTSAVSASEPSAGLRNDNCLGQYVHVHLGFVPTGPTCRYYGETEFAGVLEDEFAIVVCRQARPSVQRPRDRRICQAGARSRNALVRARAAGRDDVKHYAGVMSHWRTFGADVTV